jgi:hypothetical protein
VKLTTHLHLVPRSKNALSYTFPPPVRLHGVVLSLKTQEQIYLSLYHEDIVVVGFNSRHNQLCDCSTKQAVFSEKRSRDSSVA